VILSFEASTVISFSHCTREVWGKYTPDTICDPFKNTSTTLFVRQQPHVPFCGSPGPNFTASVLKSDRVGIRLRFMGFDVMLAQSGHRGGKRMISYMRPMGQYWTQQWGRKAARRSNQANMMDTRRV
jgi:hypothetical protein